MEITDQIDAALRLIKKKRPDLAEGLGEKLDTVNTWFRAGRVSSGHLERIKKYLENNGVEITGDGVRLIKKDIRRYEGTDGFIAFMKDVLEESKHGDPKICVSNVDEKNWQNNIGDFHQPYIDTRKKLKIPPSKILVKTGDNYHTASEFAEYRESPKDAFTKDISFYAYASKLALINFSTDPITVLVLDNEGFADGFRKTFMHIWEKSEVTK